MKLVLEYSIGDGCTYSCTDTVPIEYESAEQLYYDIDTCFKNKQNFKYKERVFDWRDFYSEKNYYPPDIYTIDEWFNK